LGLSPSKRLMPPLVPHAAGACPAGCGDAPACRRGAHDYCSGPSRASETFMTLPVLPEASPESVGLNPGRLARLSAVMARQVEDKKAPGLSLVIARHGKIAYRDFIGLLRPGGPPIGEDAIFRIYSMTKPIVSVAAMTLVEGGRLLLSDPAAKYLPAFAETKVGIERDGEIELRPPERPITVLDLMRHTSGLTYGFLGAARIHRMTHEAHILSHHRSMDEHMSVLAGLPLLRTPGLAWEYSHSTDVLGRIVEIVAEMSLGQLLEERIFAPLGMEDTAFHTPPGKVHRRAEPFSMDSRPAPLMSTPSTRQRRRATNSPAPASSRPSATTPGSARCCRAAARTGAFESSARASSTP
jgi:CubicO group peptidase (beta-lactamase class C family)